MKNYKKFFFSLVLFGAFIGTRSFAGGPELLEQREQAHAVTRYDLDSHDWLTDEGQSSSSSSTVKLPPKPQKGDLLFMGADRPFSEAKDKALLKKSLKNLSDDGVMINLITGQSVGNNQRIDALKTLGFDFKEWNTLPLPKGTKLSDPNKKEGESDVFEVDENGIPHTLSLTPGHSLSYKSAAILGLLKKLQDEHRLPHALYFIDGREEEILGLQVDIKNPPIPIYAIFYKNKLTEKGSVRLRKLYNEQGKLRETPLPSFPLPSLPLK